MSNRSLLLATLVSLAAGCGDQLSSDTRDDTVVEISAVTATVPLYLRQFMMFENHEDIGDPEIFVKCITASGKIGRKDLTNVDDELYSYMPNVKVMDVAVSEAFVDCQIWEDDSNENDYLGHVVVAMADLNGWSSATQCAGGQGPYLQIGVSKVAGANMCPEITAMYPYYRCNHPCDNFVLVRP